MVTILIIDNDDDLRDSLEDMLLLEGYSVMSAGGGKQGLGLIGDNTIDLVLCDYEMPGLTGAEVLSSIRAQPETEALPFIMMSGAQRPELEQSFEFLAKPFHLEALLELIRRVC